MAGGVGSRFWPMSTHDYPKQFIDVMGVGDVPSSSSPSTASSPSALWRICGL